MSVERVTQLRDDRDVLAELLERFENRRELEVRSGGSRRPEAGALAERHEHGSTAPVWTRGGGAGPVPRRPGRASVAPLPRRTRRPDTALKRRRASGRAVAVCVSA